MHLEKTIRKHILLFTFLLLIISILNVNNTFNNITINYNSKIEINIEKKQYYTKHICINGENKQAWAIDNDGLAITNFIKNDLYKQSCLFNNLGIHEDGYFVYIIEKQYEYEIFNDESRKYLIEYFQIRNMSLKFRYNYNEYINYDTNNYVIGFSTCRPTNFPNGANSPGHSFDYIWHVFKSIYDFNFINNTENILILHPFPFNNVNCKLIQNKFWGTISRNRVYYDDFFILKSYNILSNLLISQLKEKEVPPFENLPQSAYTRAYRDYALKINNVINNNKKLTIGIREKSKRHRFINHNDIIKHLKTKYKDYIIINLKEQLIENLNVYDEINIINSLDIYITPAGGGSYSTLFLQDYSTAIIGKICWPIIKTNTTLLHNSYKLELMSKNISSNHEIACIGSDQFLWKMYPYFYRLYIKPKKSNDFIFDCNHFSNEKDNGQWYSTINAFCYSYKISTDMLDNFINYSINRLKK